MLSIIRRGIPAIRKFTQLASPAFSYSGQCVSSAVYSNHLTQRCTAGVFVPHHGLHSSPSAYKRRKLEDEPQPRELDLMRYDMKTLKNAPRPALYLTYASLVPFISAPLLMSITETYYPEIAFAQVTYGALIVSFFGGARWGFAIPENSPSKPDWMNLANGAVLPLLAWMALLFKDSITEAATVVIMGLGIALHYDLSLLPGYPGWFRALRAIFTVLSAFSLVATLIVKGVFPEKTLINAKNS
ncbi:transmembrane protein 69 isoform X2 [Protopterus annectens]|nr:transmembrane protein 69 isoform X2 [Protopterus annectens]XP_043941867.1 transmembrane protein 69 isoform X2 [Protopterus annectens]